MPPTPPTPPPKTQSQNGSHSGHKSTSIGRSIRYITAPRTHFPATASLWANVMFYRTHSSLVAQDKYHADPFKTRAERTALIHRSHAVQG
jgi:hypothetical protein